jgi:hypothetical protein
MPLPVEAIQLDGGSEFKAEFEQACQANEQLLVLVELVTPRSIDPRTVPGISAITTGPTASSPDKPRPVTTKRAEHDAPVISDVLIPLIPDRGLSPSPGKPMTRHGRLRHGD